MDARHYSADGRGSPAPTDPSAQADRSEVPGRIEVRERVYRTVGERAAADAVGVAQADVRVDVRERSTGLAVSIRTPIPVPALDDASALAGARTVLDQGRALQERIQRDLSRLYGHEVIRVDLTVTGARTPQKRRVR